MTVKKAQKHYKN